MPSIDTLLAFPLLSIFAVPYLLTSYSTSLNLLFFYITWATLVWSHPALRIELVFTIAVRLLFYVAPSLLFLVFDLLAPSISQGLKFHGSRALPQRVVNNDYARIAKLVGLSTFNVVLGAALVAAVDYVLSDVIGTKTRLKITTTLPMPWSIARDLTKAFIIRGSAHFYIHRHLLHSRSSSPILTKMHGSWHHQFRACLPFGAHYDHPIAALFLSWLPTYLPAIFFRFHILTFELFLACVSLEEAFTYNGYSALPSTILLAGMARRKNAHMRNGGSGNFGHYGVFDWIHGTTLPGPDVVDDVIAEAEKRDLKGRARQTVDMAQDAVGNAVDSALSETEQAANDRRRRRRRRNDS